jgi:hypothetical protein
MPELEKKITVLDNERFGKVYSRKKMVIPESTRVQASNLAPMNKVRLSDSSLRDEIESHQDLPIAIRKWTRKCTKRPPYPLAQFFSFKKFSPSHRAFLVSLNTIVIPKTLSEALTNESCKQAMTDELATLEKNKTWKLVKLLVGKKPVSCKWVYTVKYRADGSIERYKARLVAKVYTQTYGIDYLETFAPVAKMNTIRVLLSLAANYGWKLQQFDVNNAFLHGELKEEIYMEVPPGYGDNLVAQTVCKLKKTLYGLKQSPREWFGRFARDMIATGYKQSRRDHNLFIKHFVSGGVTMLLVYIDDIIITGNDDKERQYLSQCLAKKFEIKALQRLKYFFWDRSSSF